MFLMLHIVLMIHLLFLPDTWSCESWEYSIGGECCPKCDPGLRVLTHCTRSTNTVCVPCNPGWFMDHPNGLTMCLKCRQCSPGNHMQVKERCHYSQNTKCTCQPGFFCSYQLEEDSCDICVRHSNAPPGFRVTQVGTETQDVKFEPCPPGTFSSKEMSLSCVKWTDCSEKDMVKTRSGNATSDVVCEPLPQSHLPLILGLGIPAVLIPPAFLLAFLLWRKKAFGKKKEVQAEQPQEKDHMMTPIQETAPNIGEPSYA
ncbi:tumor necrosis factor receptor superfamily member 14 isoform X2 [Thamnophis elegans]|uniref:tumor necrosis factor receptor superfamily member 14 isoform X2 n=1 Tax=Thamnophis elegans TaxID=35005 RepID=UPI0013771F66|nr:tumor necrosis factor receptor superfamily member 14 isoform X2 [Thamnophis elegans]